MADTVSTFPYQDASPACSDEYLLPVIQRFLDSLPVKPETAFDLGCGNGAVANWLTQRNIRASGVDPSETGIAQAKKAYPNLNLYIGSAYDPLSETYGKFPLVISLEVVEHVYDPRKYARCIPQLLEPGGYALISTPYHGYLKNLAMAISGKLDAHFTALWDHGHIKFWSPRTITILLEEAGLNVVTIHRVGRLPALAKSMLIVAQNRG